MNAISQAQESVRSELSTQERARPSAGAPLGNRRCGRPICVKPHKLRTLTSADAPATMGTGCNSECRKELILASFLLLQLTRRQNVVILIDRERNSRDCNAMRDRGCELCPTTISGVRETFQVSGEGWEREERGTPRENQAECRRGRLFGETKRKVLQGSGSSERERLEAAERGREELESSASEVDVPISTEYVRQDSFSGKTRERGGWNRKAYPR